MAGCRTQALRFAIMAKARNFSIPTWRFKLTGLSFKIFHNVFEYNCPAIDDQSMEAFNCTPLLGGPTRVKLPRNHILPSWCHVVWFTGLSTGLLDRNALISMLQGYVI